VQAAGSPRFIVEPGSGTGSKTRHILTAAAEHSSVRYLPIDISRAALQACSNTLGVVAGVFVEPIEGTYLEGLDLALTNRRSSEPALVLFLGSTIGNFTRPEATSFLRAVRRRMRPGDSLLLGTDLVKPRATLLRAYDDDAGVTAAFNFNLLARINRELHGHFDIREFTHEARYNERHSRVEMHLKSRIEQEVNIEALRLTVTFAAGESIWTESSHKFAAEGVVRLGRRGGWECRRQWIDHEWGFAETLFVAA
jgi:dimethylhistidine N-methyltransferase